MKLVLFALVAIAASSAAAQESHYSYGAKAVGSWVPPAPPAKEVTHLEGVEGNKIPAPLELVEKDASVAQHSSVATRKLLEAAVPAAGVSTKKVPHNWFGTGTFKAPAFSIATGKEECDVCKSMIGAAKPCVTKPAPPAKPNLCGGVDAAFKDMCQGYSQYMQECPSFVHDICHEDVGGSERLRSPCPDHLKCYYCLRINPLYCI